MKPGPFKTSKSIVIQIDLKTPLSVASVSNNLSTITFTETLPFINLSGLPVPPFFCLLYTKTQDKTDLVDF